MVSILPSLSNLLQRQSFFAVIALLGPEIFRMVADRHHQRDALLEAEAAKQDDMIERVQHAAD